MKLSSTIEELSQFACAGRTVKTSKLLSKFKEYVYSCSISGFHGETELLLGFRSSSIHRVNYFYNSSYFQRVLILEICEFHSHLLFSFHVHKYVSSFV